jgi:hypothetical protein
MAILLRGLALIGDVKQPILLVTDLGLEEETVTRLTRVFDNVIGHLKMAAWAAGYEVDTVNRITADEFEAAVKIGESKVIDVVKKVSTKQNTSRRLTAVLSSYK